VVVKKRAGGDRSSAAVWAWPWVTPTHILLLMAHTSVHLPCQGWRALTQLAREPEYCQVPGGDCRAGAFCLSRAGYGFYAALGFPGPGPQIQA
jgi:hypothetical protein